MEESLRNTVSSLKDTQEYKQSILASYEMNDDTIFHTLNGIDEQGLCLSIENISKYRFSKSNICHVSIYLLCILNLKKYLDPIVFDLELEKAIETLDNFLFISDIESLIFINDI